MHRSLDRDRPHVITVQTDVPDSWPGWRFTPNGRYLVTPDGDQLTPERIRGIAWRESMELRLAGYASRRQAEKRVRQQMVKVVIVELRDWQARHFGSSAG